MRVFFDAANGLLLALMTTTVFARLSALPARIPVHFNIQGSPDRWDSKETILVLVGVAWALTVMFYAIVLLLPRLRRRPDRLNIPYKQEFLKLSPEKQQAYWSVLTEFMAALAASVNLLFYLILTGMLDVAAGKRSGLPAQTLAVGLGVMAVILIIYTRRLVTIPKKLVKGEY
jgi:uncharacterized membrane protein